MDLKEAILDWIKKREAALRDVPGCGGARRMKSRVPHGASDAYAESERRLLEAVAATNVFDVSPLAEAARLWQAAKRTARLAQAWARHGTGPCPEIMHALHAAEAVLHVLVTGNPGLSQDHCLASQSPELRRADELDDASYEFLAVNTDTWVIRDCEEEVGCTVVERLHRQEVKRASREDREPEPVQVIDVPPDLCGLLGRALLSRAGRVNAQKRTSESA